MEGWPRATCEVSSFDAPLLLSLEAQRRLGLVLDLNREIAHSQALDRDLRLVTYNGLFGLRLLPGSFAGATMRTSLEDQPHSVHEATNPESNEEELEYNHQDEFYYKHDADTMKQVSTGYIAVDEMKKHSMSRHQSTTFRAGVQALKGQDRIVWNQLGPDEPSRRRPYLPKGCKTLLMEIFAGCAMLTSLAHYTFGYPVSEPVDINYDPKFDLTTKAGRDYVDHMIEEDDPYLISFAPVCSPWSPWQRINASRSEYDAWKIAEERKRWLPVVAWIKKTVKERLRRGRHAFIENPWGSAIWQTMSMRDLLEENPPSEGRTMEPFERVRVDLCSYGLVDEDSGYPYLKPTGIATACRSLMIKEAFGNRGRCDGGHERVHLEGGTKCKRAQRWTTKFCYEILHAYLQDLGDGMTRQAFPAEGLLEADEDEDDSAVVGRSLDGIYGPEDEAVPGYRGPQVEEAEAQNVEIPHPPTEDPENAASRRDGLCGGHFLQPSALLFVVYIL